MNKLLLISATALLLLGSETINSEPPKSLTLKIPVVDHAAERLEIEARCYANETSKSKADWDAFVLSLTEKEKQKAAKFIQQVGN